MLSSIRLDLGILAFLKKGSVILWSGQIGELKIKTIVFQAGIICSFMCMCVVCMLICIFVCVCVVFMSAASREWLLGGMYLDCG